MTPEQLQPLIDQLIAQVLRLLDIAEPPAGLAEGLRLFKKRKGELSSQAVAERLGLNVNELTDFSKVLRDLERGGDGTKERNRLLTQLRFISWMELLATRGAAVELDDSVEALVSEELGRKQVRALELILRSLINERFGDQRTLEQGLNDLLGSQVVAKWRQSSDADDLLSGTTFSELASLFVNNREYPNYSPLFEESPFLTYLRDKRKTIQSFLDDIRRIRNVLAHNKRISNTQLSLLDLYYEELISPVQEAHDQGQTKVDPESYLDVSGEDLERYFGAMTEDLAEVKDDIAEFRAAMEASLGVIAEDTATIRRATGQIGRRQLWIGIGVVVVIIGIGVVIWLTQKSGEDTAAVRETTDRIEQQGAETQRMVSEAAESFNASVSAIQEGFSSLSKLGGIIDQPERPEQFYHNARIYELRGDFLNARKSYEAFLGFGLDVIDPSLRFIAILKAQEGLQGAAAAYANSQPSEPSVADQVAATQLLTGEARTQRLRALAAEHEDFAPLYYLMADQHSVKQLGQQSLHNKREEKKALTRFLELAEQGELLKYFIDKEMASEWLEDAQARLKALEMVETAPSDKPNFIYKATRSNSGWQLYFNFPEVVRRFSYRVGESGDFIDAGVSDFIDQRLGEPPAVTWFQLPATQKDTPIYVKYVDVQGRENGPFKVDFTTSGELEKSQKQILGMTKGSWVAFNASNPGLLYFSHLQSYRCALSEVRFGLDKPEPDTVWTGLGACDPDDPNRIGPELEIYREIPPATQYVSVQLTYKDGSRSAVERIERR